MGEEYVLKKCNHPSKNDRSESCANTYQCRKEKKENGFGSLEVTKNKPWIFFAMKHRPGCLIPN
jgi:hypothetical protein